MTCRGKSDPLWRYVARSFNWSRLTEIPEGMIFSMTGLCGGDSIAIWSCGQCCRAFPAGNLLRLSDASFICVYSQVLRCIAFVHLLSSPDVNVDFFVSILPLETRGTKGYDCL